MSVVLHPLPDKEQIHSAYSKHYDVLSYILAAIENRLKNVISLVSAPMYKSRVKEFNSYYAKLLRVKPEEAAEHSGMPVLTDLIGIRVICAFLEDLSKVEMALSEHFTIREIERKGAEQTFKEFGYESIHILVDIPPDIIERTNEYIQDADLTIPAGLVCEIQLRTILQDAWAEVEHELVYKSEFSPFDLPLRRKLASMNASLCLADIIFQEIRDYQNKLNKELAFRREAFYEKVDDLSAGFLPEAPLPHTHSAFTAASPYVRGTIDDMILEALHAHNTGQIDRAIEIYTRIINTIPPPNDTVLSVIYKHRGMAHFAQNMFDNALADFLDSVQYDPKNFRSLYYIGIVSCIEGNDSQAIEYFTQSLEINEFQSHVYYRRALSYYKLSDYLAAMNDLTRAKQLGLDDDDCRRLNSQLVSKLDMAI
ncbi:MAG TPA: (p)ppGpp synthetase [Candidatus Treponema faecavium]|nr:(p)ppGpp synthetase [Candidatus Treponema faecavium]